MANEQNLIPFTSEQSREEAERNGRKGGIASGAARRRKKSLKEAADLYLSLPLRDKRKLNAMIRDGIDVEDADNQMAIIVALAKMAQAGDAKSAKLLFELLDESGAEQPSTPDDGFIDALREEASDVWQE